MKNKILTIFMLLALFLSACNVKGDSTMTTLNDSHWVLEQINGQPVIENTLPTLSFRGDQQLGGNASCNNFFGSFTAEGNKVTFSGFGSTQMYCAEPAGLMDQEAAYLAALESAKTYRIEDGKLLIIDDAGATVLVFSAQNMSLEGTTWNLISFNDGQSLTSLVIDTEINAEFKDGAVSGSSGCNTYTGDFQQNGLELSFGDLASTLMLCQEEGVMEQENAYLQALAKVTHYIVDGNNLTFYDANDLIVAQFSR